MQCIEEWYTYIFVKKNLTLRRLATGVTKTKNMNSDAGIRLRTAPLPISSGRMYRKPLSGGGTCSRILSYVTATPKQHNITNISRKE